MRAQHRLLDDFCSTDPHRLKSMISVHARDIEASGKDIKPWGHASWAVGVYLNLPIDCPLDHLDLHPIWRATGEMGVYFIHHSFSAGYPGYRDLWRHPFLGRIRPEIDASAKTRYKSADWVG